MTSPSSAEALSRLRWLQRFHVRTSLAFGLPVAALLTLIGVLTHLASVEREMDVLRGTLNGLSVGLSKSIDPADVRSLDAPGEESTPEYARLRALFVEVAELRPEVKSIYVFRRSEQPDQLAFAIDWVRAGTPGQVGELYDASQAPSMLDGFERPTLEPETYTDAWGRVLSGYAPIRDRSGEVVGIVGVDISARQVDALERRALVTTSVVVGLALGLFLLGGALLGRNVRRPLERIIAATEAIAEGAPGARTGLVRSDELGILAQRIDGLARELEERDRLRSIFGRYVSEDVARRVLTDDAPGTPRARQVTALFVDIRGYSTFSEHVAPVQVIELLNEYFTAMIDVIDAHQGCVIELLGDAILAVFGAPDPLEDHAEQAVRCVLAMRDRLDALNREWEERGVARLWQERGLGRFGARMGVHTDTVVAGSFGTDRRTKYAVLGRAVNLAIALEALNKPLETTILVTDRVVAQLPDELARRAEPRGEHTLRGEPIAVHSL